MSVRIAYKSDRVTLYHGDCAEAVDLVERASCGLLLTDPPYGVRWQSSFRKKQFTEIENDDGSIDVPGILGEWTRALISGRHAYVFGFSPDAVMAPMRLGGTCELIWDKCHIGLGDLSQPWGPRHERIAFGVFQKSPSDREGNRGALSARLRRGSVLSVPRRTTKSSVRHQTEKPVELLVQLIESSSTRGDIVLDPFAGSGSTLVAAILTGRRAIGVEITSDHVATAIERIKSAERLAAQMEAA